MTVMTSRRAKRARGDRKRYEEGVSCIIWKLEAAVDLSAKTAEVPKFHQNPISPLRAFWRKRRNGARCASSSTMSAPEARKPLKNWRQCTSSRAKEQVGKCRLDPIGI